jgi:hypothetical protein
MVCMGSSNSRFVLRRCVGVAAVASLAAVMSACGGDDGGGGGDAGVDDTNAGASSEDASDTTDSSTSDTDDTTSTVDLSPVQACLEGLGVSVEPADDTNSPMPAEMRANLGIEAMLVFDKGAGWGGSIEAYASSTEADVAEAGYIESSWGYEVGRVDDVVFKTTGPVDDIAQIEGCLTGEPVASPDETTTTVPDETVPESTVPAETGSDDAGSDDADEGTDAARNGIVAMLTDPGLEEQGVIFDRACLDGWVAGLLDADATLLFDNGGDTEDPAVSAEGVAHAELVFACLDLDAIAVRYADELVVDVDCVRAAFAEFDLDAAVAQAPGDIDSILNVLAANAEGCE